MSGTPRPDLASESEVRMVPVSSLVRMRKSNDTYADEDGELGLGKGDLIEVRIPAFQRGLKWNDDRLKEFHDSLIQGWPVGVMVLAVQESQIINVQTGLRKNILSLIDGQQRTWALSRLIADFWSEPWYAYRSPKWESAGPAVGSIVDAHAALEELSILCGRPLGEVENAIAIASRRYKAELFADYPEFLETLSQVLGLVQWSDAKAARSAARRLCEAIISQFEELQSIRVPVLLVNEALRSQLPMIFRRLNEGVPLKGYDLLAATWDSVKIRPQSVSPAQQVFLDQALAIAGERIETSYPSDGSSGYVLDPNVEQMTTDDLSLFDMLYAVSRSVDGSAFASVKSDVLAFQVAAQVLNGSISKVSPDLARVFPLEPSSNSPSITVFPKLFDEAVHNINIAMKPLMDVSSSNLTLRGRLGLTPSVVYISTFLTHHNQVSVSQDRLSVGRRGSSAEARQVAPGLHLTSGERLARLKECLPAWYVHDALTSVFSGSRAYDAANDRVWAEFQSGAGKKQTYTLRPANRMLSFPTLEQMFEGFERLWRAELNVDKTPQRRRVSDGGSILLRAAHSDGSLHDVVLDHVVPIAKGRASAAARGELYPLNHVANLMPLSELLNNRRRDRDWVEFWPYMSESERQLVSSTLLMESSDVGASTLASRADFTKFLRIRFRLLIEQALENLRVAEWSELEANDKAGWLGNVAVVSNAE